jgi:hypothetical protein
MAAWASRDADSTVGLRRASSPPPPGAEALALPIVSGWARAAGADKLAIAASAAENNSANAPFNEPSSHRLQRDILPVKT